MHNAYLLVIPEQSQPSMNKKSQPEKDICSKFITPATRDRGRAKTDPFRGQESHTPCAHLHKHLKAASQTEYLLTEALLETEGA